MKNHDEEDDPSSPEKPDRLPEHVAEEIGRTVRDALNSRTRTAHLCLILATIGAGIAAPLLIGMCIALLIISGR